MPGVSKEQIAKAREIPLIAYLERFEPDNIQKVGNEYSLKDHDSLKISADGKFNWHSRNVGGYGVIDYLVKVREIGFVDAVKMLVGEEYTAVKYTPVAKENAENKPKTKIFEIPQKYENNNRAKSYLFGRGIDTEIIDYCIDAGIIYEEKKYHNCVFVGKNESGEIKYAMLRGTYGVFKCEATGSEKKHSFLIPPSTIVRNPDAEKVAVFESPIEALSHATLFPDWDGWRLSLGGTATIALEHFLDNHAEINLCYVCTNKDEAGNKALEKINKLQKVVDGEVKTERVAPKIVDGKDWNDLLKEKRGIKPKSEPPKAARSDDYER